MTHLQNPLNAGLFTENWNEELARTKRYNEAKQRLSKEKLLRSELEKAKRTQMGGLKVKP